MTELQNNGRSEDDHDVVLMSIRTRFVRLILSGAKTLELRKKIPKSPVGRSLLVYSSGEEKAITAHGRVVGVITGPPDVIWKQHAEHLGITHDEFQEYFRGSEVAYALELEDITPSRRQFSLEELRDEHGLEPPQSWRYLSRDTYSSLIDAV